MTGLLKCLMLAGLSGLWGCAASLHAAPAGLLSLACSEREALVYVDGKLAGKADDFSRHPLPLSPGNHRLELRAEGKLTAYREVIVRPNRTDTLEISLRPDLDQEDAAPAF